MGGSGEGARAPPGKCMGMVILGTLDSHRSLPANIEDVLLTVEGVTEGLELSSFSQHPTEQEALSTTVDGQKQTAGLL